jgi:hypothetical protein
MAKKSSNQRLSCHTTSTFLIALLLIAQYPTFISGRAALGGSRGVLGGRSEDASSSPTDMFDPLNLADIGKAWQIPPLDKDEVVSKLGKEHRDVSRYICNALGNKPLCVQLRKKIVGMKGTGGGGPELMQANMPQRKFRALVTLGSQEPKKDKLSAMTKLRSVWFVGSSRASSTSTSIKDAALDTLTKSYEETISSSFPHSFELEIILPKVKRGSPGGNPVISYSIPVAGGSTNPKSRSSQSNGVVTIYPKGKKSKATADEGEGIVVGSTSLNLHSGPSLVDWSWAKGKKNIWKGRKVGQI